MTSEVDKTQECYMNVNYVRMTVTIALRHGCLLQRNMLHRRVLTCNDRTRSVLYSKWVQNGSGQFTRRLITILIRQLLLTNKHTKINNLTYTILEYSINHVKTRFGKQPLTMFIVKMFIVNILFRIYSYFEYEIKNIRGNGPEETESLTCVTSSQPSSVI